MTTATLHNNTADKENQPEGAKKYVPPHLRRATASKKQPLNVNAPSFDMIEPIAKKAAIKALPSKKTAPQGGQKTRFRTPLKSMSNANGAKFFSPVIGSGARKAAASKKTPSSHQKKTPKKTSDLDDDNHKDTQDNSGPYIHDQFAFEMLQHAVFSNGSTVASPNDDIKTIPAAADAPQINLEEEITIIEGIVGLQQEEGKELNQLPWKKRLQNLASHCKIEEPEDYSASELIGKILLHHVEHVIRHQWKYDRNINKICKLMIAFLSEIVSKNLSYEWNRELMAQILLARLVYSRQLGNKWIRRMWRTTNCSIRDVVSVDERRNTVYALFNCKTKKLYINCVRGGSMLEAFQWISSQTQDRIRMGNIQDIIVTPCKSPQSVLSSPADASINGSAVKSFNIYQDEKSPAAKSPWRTPAKKAAMSPAAALASPMRSSPAVSDSSSPSSVRSVQQPQTDPFGYIGKIGLQHWILMPLDTLTDADAEYIEHRTKQRVHECRHRVVDNTLFFRKIKKPPKKMSSKRYNRFVELRQRQKQKRREEAISAQKSEEEEEQHSTSSVDQKQGEILEESEVCLAKPITPTKKAEKKSNVPQSLLLRKALKICIPEDDESSDSSSLQSCSEKENTPTTPSSTRSFCQALKSPTRSALGPLSPAIVSNRNNLSE